MKSKKTMFMAKKAFTLLEVMISITIFTIILLFLYKTLDETKASNEKFEKHIYKKEDINHLYKIIAEDIAESSGKITNSRDMDKNSVLIFKTNNSFNKPFYTNVSYMISSNADLVRIESKDKFKKENSGIAFYNNAFIDVLLKNVKKFIVIEKGDKFIFVIEQEKKDKIMFSTFKMES